MLQQQQPFVVEVLRQPQATPDVSIEAVLGMFALAGVAVLLALVGGVVAGALIVAIKRVRERSDTSPLDTGHARLRI